MSATRLIAVEYEVFGLVQGVFFRKYTSEKAKSLGLRGFVKNTNRSTVIGELQGPEDKVNEMKEWLKHTGSPQSQIDKVVFTNENVLQQFSYDSFRIEH